MYDGLFSYPSLFCLFFCLKILVHLPNVPMMYSYCTRWFMSMVSLAEKRALLLTKDNPYIHCRAGRHLCFCVRHACLDRLGTNSDMLKDTGKSSKKNDQFLNCQRLVTSILMNVPTVFHVSLLKSSGLLSLTSSSCKPFSKNMAKAKGNYLLSDAGIV